MITLALITISFVIGFEIGKSKNWKFKDYGTDFDSANLAEKKVRHALEKLDKSQYYVMNDVTLPAGEGTTQIDHIVFSRTGIFVIETKGHKGWILGNQNSKMWTQRFANGKSFTFFNPIMQNAYHIRHLVSISNAPHYAIKSIIIFATAETEIKNKLPEYVMKLDRLNTYIERWKLNNLSEKELNEIIGCIEFKKKQRSRDTNNAHINYVKSRIKN